MQRDRQADRWIGSQSKRKEVNETETIKITREKKRTRYVCSSRTRRKETRAGDKTRVHEGGGGGGASTVIKIQYPTPPPGTLKLDTCQRARNRQRGLKTSPGEVCVWLTGIHGGHLGVESVLVAAGVRIVLFGGIRTIALFTMRHATDTWIVSASGRQ